MSRFPNLALAILLLFPVMATAAPVNYALQPDRSEVGFNYTLSGAQNRGTMPVSQASIQIDFDTFTASSVVASVDVRGARTGLIFATEALKASSVLDARNHPTIRFQSTAIRPNDLRNLSAGGKIDGLLTIRGITQPVTLDASLFRQQGTEAGDLSQLSFRISGAVSRSAFGASGYSDLVADTIELDIAARVVRAE
ncbi:YceI family protein [Loktanella sp. Alg231-35]|uniref:YceI family protein n=1 Tax=Loktanella sp. Alg231-35 TaxID=1922220 RepID=UPI000D552E2A|nr:YceI family protein [Loktanella sp. Alg231-35]